MIEIQFSDFTPIRGILPDIRIAVSYFSEERTAQTLKTYLYILTVSSMIFSYFLEYILPRYVAYTQKSAYFDQISVLKL